MEAERTQVNVARERALVVHQEAQTEHKRAVMMVLPSSYRPAAFCSGSSYNEALLIRDLAPCCALLGGQE